MTSKQDSTAFQYDAAQRSAVVDTIPATKAADAKLMTSVCQRLEDAASNFRALTAHHRRRFPRGEPSPAIVWKRRRDLIAKALAGVNERSVFAAHLSEAYRIADAHFVGFDMLGKGHKGTLNSARDALYECVLDVWTRDLGGELTTSGVTRKNGEREATNPAIRFFEAVVGPIVDRPIKGDAIAKVIIAERKRQQKSKKAKAEIEARARAAVISSSENN